MIKNYIVFVYSTLYCLRVQYPVLSSCTIPCIVLVYSTPVLYSCTIPCIVFVYSTLYCLRVQYHVLSSCTVPCTVFVYSTLYCTVPCILVGIKFVFSRQISKNPEISDFMKIRAVGADVFYVDGTDGTDGQT